MESEALISQQKDHPMYEITEIKKDDTVKNTNTSLLPPLENLTKKKDIKPKTEENKTQQQQKQKQKQKQSEILSLPNLPPSLSPQISNNNSDTSNNSCNSNKRSNKITWKDCHSFSAECHICKKIVNDYEEYCTHLKDEHYDIRDDLEWLTCDVCGKMNAHKSNFISHLASHTGRKPFKCRVMLHSGEYCCTNASTRQNLQTHILKVHKMAVKHKLVQTTKKSPNKKKKKKKKHKHKHKKKRKYQDIDLMPIDESYGYSYKPRKSKRRRTRKLTVEQQKDTPFCHPLEILIAAATFVEMEMDENTEITNETMKEAARNWQHMLGPKTINNLQNVADQIDDICTTEQIVS